MLGMAAEETRPCPWTPFSPPVTHLNFKTTFHTLNTLTAHLETPSSPNLFKTQNRSGTDDCYMKFVHEETQICIFVKITVI